MIKVYGYSDDNLVIEGAPYPNDEISCFDKLHKNSDYATAQEGSEESCRTGYKGQ